MTVRIGLEFEADASAEITVGNLMSHKQRLFEVRARNGALRYDDLAEDKLAQCAADGVWRAVALSGEPPLTRMLRHFRDAIAGGLRDHDGLILGLQVVETLARVDAGLKR